MNGRLGRDTGGQIYPGNAGSAASGGPVGSVRNVGADALQPAINVQRTCGKHPDHIPKRREIGH
jgi:hypothetical protein